ncbi:hypothetical protein [Lyngbya aestuarii]|uniref:hypothetical protein n=1 Tax=Lyngbya aestuarii TaxID=118322 RepID=UPI00403DD124
MINSWSNYYSRQTTLEEEILYRHLLDCVEVESPSELIERFRRLFIEGVAYPNPKVWYALKKIVASNTAGRDFKFILNRSCYILINHWLGNPRCQNAIPQLIELLEISSASSASSQTKQPLHELVRRFTETEQYLTLRRLAKVISDKTQRSEDPAATPLGILIHRYPCLYEHCLLTDDSTEEQRQKIRLMREQKQQQLEINLSRYITYQKFQRNSQSIKNPTLLSDRQLDIAIQEFSGKIDGFNTHRDLAEQFRTYSRLTRSYRTFKKEFYHEYLIPSIDPKYGRGEFGQRLYQQLQSILSQNDSQKLSDDLLEVTCKKLLNFLVVESSRKATHYVFSDLTSNIGITSTIGLLLKIVLLCNREKHYLEQRFVILFNHYETQSRQKNQWLVESLENLNVAWSTNFGAMNL